MQYLVFDKDITQRWRRVNDFINSCHEEDFWQNIKAHTRLCGAVKPLLETTFSASCVSRITKSLDAKVKEFHRRSLLDEYQFLFLDGITLSVKASLKAVKKLVLVAYGITDNFEVAKKYLKICFLSLSFNSSPVNPLTR